MDRAQRRLRDGVSCCHPKCLHSTQAVAKMDHAQVMNIGEGVGVVAGAVMPQAQAQWGN